MKTLIFALGLLTLSNVVHAQENEHAPYITPKCDAQIVVEHMGMRQELWLDTIDQLEAVGTMGHDWAEEFRQLIREAYQLKTQAQIDAWVKQRCSGDRT